MTEYQPDEYLGDGYDRPPTIEEMIYEIVEYQVRNATMAEVRQILDQYFTYHLQTLPPEALQEAYDGLFNR